MNPESLNFAFLEPHDPQLVRLGSLAERYFTDDPSTCLIKLRQFGELLAQLTAARSGMFGSTEETQADLLRRLHGASVLPREVGDLFHQVRALGNRAAHEQLGDHADALAMLKLARQLGVWFHRTFNDPRFAPGPFAPPPDPTDATTLLQIELDRLKRVLDETRSEAERARSAAEHAALAQLSAEERAHQEYEDRAIWEQLAAETEQAKAALAHQLQALQFVAAQATAATTLTLVAQGEAAAQLLDIDEATTCALIDAQLRARGWEADTLKLRYSVGTRPMKGRNLAIAEWPTRNGMADYALFVGTQCIGIVEAKRRNKHVSSAIDQAQRYARSFRFEGEAVPVGGPWPDSSGDPFVLPFVFSANGRPFLKQLETASGIWFRDARRPTNLRRVRNDWPTPEDLKALLEIDIDAAHADLAAQPVDFAFCHQ